MVSNVEKLLRIGNRLQSAMCVFCICLQCAHSSYAAENSMEDYKALGQISFFGSIYVSVYSTASGDTEGDTDLSSEELMQYVRLQFGRYFTDIPYRSVDASRWSDPENTSSMGRLSCRVWSNVKNAPAAFQVKCQISTSDHLNIIDETSLGYGPKEKAAAIVREHIDRILEGFSLIFYRVRNES